MIFIGSYCSDYEYCHLVQCNTVQFGRSVQMFRQNLLLLSSGQISHLFQQRQQVPLQYEYTSTRLHGATYHKAAIFNTPHDTNQLYMKKTSSVLPVQLFHKFHNEYKHEEPGQSSWCSDYLWTTWSEVRNPVMARDLLSSKPSRSALRPPPPASYSMGTMVLYFGNKAEALT